MSARILRDIGSLSDTTSVKRVDFQIPTAALPAQIEYVIRLMIYQV